MVVLGDHWEKKGDCDVGQYNLTSSDLGISAMKTFKVQQVQLCSTGFFYESK